MRKYKGKIFKKVIEVGIVIMFFCVAIIPAINANITNINPNNSSIKSDNIIIHTSSTMEVIKEMVDNYLKIDENFYKNPDNGENYHCTRPILGNGEVFGLWISIEYNGNTYSQKIDLDLKMIQGKLTDPGYRTPIKFNVDDDPENDIEVGFGFFSYGIDEIHEDGSTTNHPSWATAFDFYQIGNQLDDQLGELEVWQEFHVNLELIKSISVVKKHTFTNLKPVSQSTQESQETQYNNPLFTRLQNKLVDLINKISSTPLRNLLNNILNNLKDNGIGNMLYNTCSVPTAEEDYLVTRVGYRSPDGEKIPLKCEKIFSVERGNIFRPFVFQHETDPNDIIGTASNDVMFGFQIFREGSTNPAYDIEFDMNLNPAVYAVTQFIPREGKIVYYYHDVGAGDPLDITFSSNLLKGGDPEEEAEGSLSLTLTFDAISEVAGSGKWMMFEPEILGDASVLGGKFIYAASHNFDVGFTANSPRFEEKIEIKGMPKSAEFSWDVDVNIDIVQGELLEADVEGVIALDMSSEIDDVIIYYPKTDSNDPDVACFKVSDIPSSREVRSGANLYIQNDSMLEINIGGFVSHDMSSSLGDISLYWPKADPENDPDSYMVHIPGGSFSNSGRTSVIGKLYVDPDPDNFFINQQNNVYAKVERTSSSDFGEIGFYLPNVDIPLVQVHDIPGNAYARGQFWWNQLKADGRIERSSSNGTVDPITFNILLDSLILSDTLSIGNGYIDTDFKIADQGWFNFDTSNDMLGNQFVIGNLDTGNVIDINVERIAAQNFHADWSLNTSGSGLIVEDFGIDGKVDAFKNFEIYISLDGDNVDFDGTWLSGDEGEFSIDFYQVGNVILDFDLGDISEAIELNGQVELRQDLHFDMSWKWEQGELSDPAYFKVNDGTNQPNIKEINFLFTYNDLWGADITLTNVGLYVCVEWYYTAGQWFIWPVFNIWGDLDLHLLLNGQWFYNVEDN